jgi:tetratricopeptide (TPR) repeat protein
MKPATICIALALVLAPCSFSGQAASRPKQSEIDSANRLFQAGKFAEAGKLYSLLAAQNPKDYSSTLQLGRIALLSNRLDDAQKWLRKAIALQPGDADARVMLAEVYYRRDDFPVVIRYSNYESPSVIYGRRVDSRGMHPWVDRQHRPSGNNSISFQ